MSRLTNYAENLLADMVRGQGLTLPANWHVALGSAADDSSFTELAGTGYGREAVARSLTAWAGTQGAGTTLASTGTSHKTSNNALIDFGTAGSAWGTANYIGLFDDSSAGNCWFYRPLNTPIVINNGSPVTISVGELEFTIGLTGGMSNYLSNKLIDLIWRGQAYAWPATLYAGLCTSAPSNAGGGIEVATGSYARASIASTMAAWSGTQGAGTTVASSGTAGRISNNVSVTFPAPTASWGTVSHAILRDASTGGNLMFWGALTSPMTISSGGIAPSFAADNLGITFA